MDRLSDLPEELLVDITSRLDAHEAVRLSVVQKRWRYLYKSLPDRFTSLPNGPLYHILQFLDIWEALQLSWIHPRWEHTWETLPTVNFNEDRWAWPTDGDDPPYYLFVRRVLDQRFLGTRIERLYVSTIDGHLCGYCLDVWAHLIKGIPHIHLEGIPDMGQSFLQDIVKQVHSLTLASVDICCDLNSQILNLSSRRMERLVLFACQGYHYFSVLLLKSCKLTSLVIDDGAMLIEKAPCGLTLNSPSLKQIYLKGSLFHNYSLIHLSSIEVACFLTSINFEDENLFQQCFNRVLRGLHKVQSLTLSADAFEVYNQALLFRCTFPRLLLVNIYDFVESEDVSKFMLSLKEKAPILMKVSTMAPILMNASIN